MAYIDDIKELTVRVENGSGVLVSPLSDEYHYVLTAHHVIKDCDDQGIQNITISFLPDSAYKDVQIEVVDVKRCEESDAAIILIKRIEQEVRFLYPSKVLPERGNRWHIGYPNNQNQKGVATVCVEHEIRNWLGRFEGQFEKYQCEQTINKNEIEGMSGGGVFDDSYHLLGIHRKFAADENKEQLSKFVMIPWGCYEQIIKDNRLPEVLPFDLSTLKTFKEKIFCFDDNIGAKMKLQPLLAQLSILKASLQEWSPRDCYEAFQQYRQARQYVMVGDMKENDWVLFGEFLVAMKILLNEKGINNWNDIFPHFQYIQSDKDFDIFDVDNQLDSAILGKVKDEEVVFVIGGIRGKGYKQDVRPKNVLRINDSREPGSMFDIARLGKDVFGAFTFVNGNLFKEAMQENTDEIQDAQDDCAAYYKELLSKKIWPKKRNTAGEA
jgi:hypothetical protein